ncbi:LysR substrate-binding domain-containing protein [Pseudaeromonas paramecii]|uniref:LysR substrate-binding domain-containing protein n=1 Tax=Pseudaeromonas paramecii TaxID=2138166 RepID=A0ABP8QL09_9GAMM
MFELKHLRSLRALYQQGSLAGAATALHLSQSALSHQLSELEQRLGEPLFVRRSRPLALTAAGRLLWQLAEQVLPSIDRVERQLRGGDGEGAPVRLAVECHSCIHWLTAPLAADHGRLFELVSGHLYEPQQALQAGELDLVLTSEVADLDGIHYEPLFDYQMQLVVAPDHPLVRLPQIRPQDLADEVLLCYPVPASRLDILRHFLTPAGIRPRRLRPVDNTQMMLQMAAARWGVALLPTWASQEYVARGALCQLPLAGGLWRRMFGAIRASARQRSPLQQLFERLRQAPIEGARALAPRVPPAS